MSAERIIAHVVISGQVQGVGYRFWTESQARSRGLRGWVRNLSNGDVEALFEGAKDAVDAMCQACWQGPPAARVQSVSSMPLEAGHKLAGELGQGFRQIATL